MSVSSGVSNKCCFCKVPFWQDHDYVITHENLVRKKNKFNHGIPPHTAHASCLVDKLNQNSLTQGCPVLGCHKIIKKEDILKWKGEMAEMTRNGTKKSLYSMARFYIPVVAARIFFKRLLNWTSPNWLTAVVEASFGVTTVSLLLTSRGDLGNHLGHGIFMGGLIGCATSSVAIIAGEIHSTTAGTFAGLALGALMTVSANSFRSGIRFRLLATSSFLFGTWLANEATSSRLINTPGLLLTTILTAGAGGALIGKVFARKGAFS